eukprot:1161686-Pelagomonas_calceolata.AAC.6
MDSTQGGPASLGGLGQEAGRILKRTRESRWSRWPPILSPHFQAFEACIGTQPSLSGILSGAPPSLAGILSSTQPSLSASSEELCPHIQTPGTCRSSRRSTTLGSTESGGPRSFSAPIPPCLLHPHKDEAIRVGEGASPWPQICMNKHL